MDQLEKSSLRTSYHPRSLRGCPGAKGSGRATGPEARCRQPGRFRDVFSSSLTGEGAALGKCRTPVASGKPAFKGLAWLTTQSHTLCHVGVLAQAKSMYLIPAMTPSRRHCSPHFADEKRRLKEFVAFLRLQGSEQSQHSSACHSASAFHCEKFQTLLRPRPEGQGRLQPSQELKRYRA